MIKIFTINNKDGKITFTKKELEELLNEAYNEGFYNGKHCSTITWTYPNYYTWTSAADSAVITVGKNTNYDKNNIYINDVTTSSASPDSISLKDYSTNTAEVKIQ